MAAESYLSNDGEKYFVRFIQFQKQQIRRDTERKNRLDIWNVPLYTLFKE